MKSALASFSAATLLLVPSGCSSSGPRSSAIQGTHGPMNTPACCLQAVADAVERARTVRIRFRHELTLRMESDSRSLGGYEGVLLLGKSGKLSLVEVFGGGGPYRLISNGTDLWEDVYDQRAGIQERVMRSTTVSELMAGIRQALTYGTILSPVYERNYPNCCRWPERRLTTQPPTDVAFLGDDTSAIAYSIETVYADNYTPKTYRATLWFDPITLAIKKHRLTLARHGDKPEFDVTEFYDEFVLNADIPEEKFAVPPEPTDNDKTKQRLAAIREALDCYLIDNHAYPTMGQGLQALLHEPTAPQAINWKGPYLKDRDALRDAWGSAFIYRCPRVGINPEGYDLSSPGPDKIPGTPDDIKR